jgi:hypothetical protein
MRLCTLDFKPRFGTWAFFPPSFTFAPSSPRHHFFASPLSLSFSPRRQSNERMNERADERTTGNSPLLTSCSPFAYHYRLFAFCIVPLSFDTRSATTMTTAIETTTMLMTTPPLLHVAQKGSKNFHCKKHGETLEFFFFTTHLVHRRLPSHCANKVHNTLTHSIAYYYWYFG